MVTCDILGDVYRKKGSPETAESWFRKSFEAGKQLLRGTNSTEVRFDVTTSCYKIGLVNRDLKRTGGQLEWFGSALKLLTILLKNKRTYETVNLLAHTLRCLGDANRDEDRKEEALRFYLRCVEAREELAEMTGETADRNGLFLTSDHVAVNLAKMGFADEARAVLEKSLARTEETAAATSSVADRDNLMVCCFRLGSLSSVPEEQRGQYLRRFTLLAQTLLAETGSDRYRDLLESQGDGSPALF